MDLKKNDRPVDLADRLAELERREKEADAREARLAEADQADVRSAAFAFADELIEGGKLAPSGKDIVADIHQRLAVSGEPVNFSDGGTAPALAEFEKLLNSAKPLINLSDVSKADQSTVLDSTDPLSLADRAEKIRADRPSLSSSEAVRVAEKEATKETQ